MSGTDRRRRSSATALALRAQPATAAQRLPVVHQEVVTAGRLKRALTVEARHDLGGARQPPGRKPRRRLPDRPRARARSGRRSTGTRPESTGRAAAGIVACAASPSTARSSTSRRATSSSRTRRNFVRIGSWRNPYLKHCHEISVWERRLFLASTGFDRVLAFDLDRKRVHLGDAGRHPPVPLPGPALRPAQGRRPADAQQAASQQRALHEGRHVHRRDCRTGGMLLFNGREIQMSVELPPGTHNARPFRDGVLFNDTEANVLRYAGRGEGREDRAMRVPHLPAEALLNRELGPERSCTPGVCARTLRALGHRSSRAGRRRPRFRSTTSPRNERMLSVNLTMDVRNAIHGLEVWPSTRAPRCGRSPAAPR